MKNSTIALLILLFLALCVLHGTIQGSDDAKLSADAQRALDKADADIAKVRHTLIQSLTIAQEGATRKGNLDQALAIKQEIERQDKLVSVSLKELSAVVPEIQKATWGGISGGPTTRDVTAAFNTALTRGPVTLENQFFGFDPAPNAGKILVVTFQRGGRLVTKTFPETSVVTAQMFAP